MEGSKAASTAALMKAGFYLLEVLDLVGCAAAVGVRRLPPHQGYALLLDFLRSQLAYQRWCCRKEEKKNRGWAVITIFKSQARSSLHKAVLRQLREDNIASLLLNK